MRKRTKMLIAILALAGTMVISFGGAALAHGPWDADDEATQDYGQMGWGHHHGGGAIWSEDVGDLLGLTAEEILAQRQEDKSLVEIAAAQGVSEDTLVEAILAARADTVQQRIDAGFCTEERADEMLEWVEQNVRQAVNRTDFGPSEDGAYCDGSGWTGKGMGYGHGGMHQSGGMHRSGGMLGGGMGFS